jgi:hypothetical protein
VTGLPKFWPAYIVAAIAVVGLGFVILKDGGDPRTTDAALVVGYVEGGDRTSRICVVAKDPRVRYIGQMGILTGCYLMDPSLAANPPAIGTCNDFRLAWLRQWENVTARFISTSKDPCNVPQNEASCFWDYFQQSKSPIGIPVAGSPDWNHPVCGP